MLIHCGLSLIVDFVTFKGPVDSVDGIDESQEEMWEHVIEWSHSIEVDYKPGDGKAVLTKVYYPFDPEVHIYLTFYGR